MKQIHRFSLFGVLGALFCSIAEPVRAAELIAQQQAPVRQIVSEHPPVTPIQLDRAWKKFVNSLPNSEQREAAIKFFMGQTSALFFWTIKKISSGFAYGVATAADPVFWLKLPERLLMLTLLVTIIVLLVVSWPYLIKGGAAAKWLISTISRIITCLYDPTGCASEKAMEAAEATLETVSGFEQKVGEKIGEGIDVTLETVLGGEEEVEKVKRGEAPILRRLADWWGVYKPSKWITMDAKDIIPSLETEKLSFDDLVSIKNAIVSRTDLNDKEKNRIQKKIVQLKALTAEGKAQEEQRKKLKEERLEAEQKAVEEARQKKAVRLEQQRLEREAEERRIEELRIAQERERVAAEQKRKEQEFALQQQQERERQKQEAEREEARIRYAEVERRMREQEERRLEEYYREQKKKRLKKEGVVGELVEQLD